MSFDILLLGAGHIGTTIAALVRAAGTDRIAVADKDPARLRRFAAQGFETLVLDGERDGALDHVLKGRDAVINALPFHAAPRVATAARDAGVHYFDLTEDVAATKAIRLLAERSSAAMMPQCGLAPGFIGIVGHDLAQRFITDGRLQLESLHMRVGALPRFPTNGLKYNLTWSTDGLINEYCNPCEAILHGQRVLAPALEGLEHFTLDGIEYEAFNTSGGLGTLCETLEGRVRNLDYKSIRYPGHCAIMKLLLDDLRLRDRRELLRGLFEAAIPTTHQDVVLVFVTASGHRHGEYVQESFSTAIFGREIAGAHHSAIQVTTAAGVLAAVDLVRSGGVPQRGFVKQEQVPLAALRANRFGRLFFADPDDAHATHHGPAASAVDDSPRVLRSAA